MKVTEDNQLNYEHTLSIIHYADEVKWKPIKSADFLLAF